MKKPDFKEKARHITKLMEGCANCEGCRLMLEEALWAAYLKGKNSTKQKKKTK